MQAFAALLKPKIQILLMRLASIHGPSLFRSLFAALMLLGFAAVAQAQTVRFAIGEWAPYTGQKLPAYGLASEIVTAASKAAGLAPSYDFVPWKRAELSVLQNAYFATFPYLQSSEREGKFQFSDVLFSSGLRVLLFKNNERAKRLNFNTVADLKGMTVLIIAGSDAVKKMLEDAKATVVESQQIESGIKMLESVRVDAIIDDQAVLFQALAALPEGRRTSLYYAEKPFGDKTSYRVMSALSFPEGKKLLDLFNTGLAKIKESGELERILNKYGI